MDRKELLNMRVDELELTVRTSSCLQNTRIERIGDLVRHTEAELLKTKAFDRKALVELKTLLMDMDLCLGMTFED